MKGVTSFQVWRISSHVYFICVQISSSESHPISGAKITIVGLTSPSVIAPTTVEINYTPKYPTTHGQVNPTANHIQTNNSKILYIHERGISIVFLFFITSLF